jgi:outer membrane protein OmpA-like peptidoglycan-associated protein
VAVVLARTGIATLAGADALGSSNPLDDGTAADRARLNRSVSFSIEARPNDRGR